HLHFSDHLAQLLQRGGLEGTHSAGVDSHDACGLGDAEFRTIQPGQVFQCFPLPWGHVGEQALDEVSVLHTCQFSGRARAFQHVANGLHNVPTVDFHHRNIVHRHIVNGAVDSVELCARQSTRGCGVELLCHVQSFPFPAFNAAIEDGGRHVVPLVCHVLQLSASEPFPVGPFARKCRVIPASLHSPPVAVVCGRGDREWGAGCSSLAYRSLHVAVGHGHGLCGTVRIIAPQGLHQRHQRSLVEILILCTTLVGADQSVNLFLVARGEHDDPLVPVRGELTVGDVFETQAFLVSACSVADCGTNDVRGETGGDQFIQHSISLTWFTGPWTWCSPGPTT